MPHRLMDRITTLLKADAHGVVEALEERSLLIKQSLREAELELLQKRARSEALGEEEQRLRELARRRSEEVRSLDDDVALALAGDKQELARFAVRRLLPKRQELAALEREIAEVADARCKLAERLAEQEVAFEELRGSARAHLARARTAPLEAEELAAPAVSDEEVDLELLRRSRRGGEEVSR